jgi:hypothetical protein
MREPYLRNPPLNAFSPIQGWPSRADSRSMDRLGYYDGWGLSSLGIPGWEVPPCRRWANVLLLSSTPIQERPQGRTSPLHALAIWNLDNWQFETCHHKNIIVTVLGDEEGSIISHNCRIEIPHWSSLTMLLSFITNNYMVSLIPKCRTYDMIVESNFPLTLNFATFYLGKIESLYFQ